jgi:hypothetical protein
VALLGYVFLNGLQLFPFWREFENFPGGRLCRRQIMQMQPVGGNDPAFDYRTLVSANKNRFNQFKNEQNSRNPHFYRESKRKRTISENERINTLNIRSMKSMPTRIRSRVLCDLFILRIFQKNLCVIFNYIKNILKVVAIQKMPNLPF